ncbi:hypothetical protein PCL_04818 [Purpureocillium lilacinum]|uniref:Uncharacterized protein n=1 Tax=Purpureocillium lilacinum TaxID=33203 RepID=A0A2U3DWP7_PURLI|nr:hypothetical protein PCL_04818 [Purpureocillium lilacinum]
MDQVFSQGPCFVSMGPFLSIHPHLLLAVLRLHPILLQTPPPPRPAQHEPSSQPQPRAGPAPWPCSLDGPPSKIVRCENGSQLGAPRLVTRGADVQALTLSLGLVLPCTHAGHLAHPPDRTAGVGTDWQARAHETRSACLSYGHTRRAAATAASGLMCHLADLISSGSTTPIASGQAVGSYYGIRNVFFRAQV